MAPWRWAFVRTLATLLEVSSATVEPQPLLTRTSCFGFRLRTFRLPADVIMYIVYTPVIVYRCCNADWDTLSSLTLFSVFSPGAFIRRSAVRALPLRQGRRPKHEPEPDPEVRRRGQETSQEHPEADGESESGWNRLIIVLRTSSWLIKNKLTHLNRTQLFLFISRSLKSWGPWFLAS